MNLQRIRACGNDVFHQAAERFRKPGIDVKGCTEGFPERCFWDLFALTVSFALRVVGGTDPVGNSSHMDAPEVFPAMRAPDHPREFI